MGDVIVAFDDFIHGITTVYSSSFFNALLGELGAYAIEVVAEGMPGTANSTLTVQLETSGDGRNWSNKNPTAEIPSLSVTAAAESTGFGYDMNVRPAAALVRLRLDFTGGPGTPGAKVVASIRPTRDPKFSPASLAGCNLWLRADRNIALAPGTNHVAAWGDGSLAGHTASQGTSARQPAYNASPINGMPTIFFDASNAGSEKILSIAGTLSLGAGHVFLVAKSISAVPPTQARSSIWNLGGSALASHFPYTDGVIYDSAGSNTRYTCGAPVATITNPYCYEVRATSSNWNSFINGTSQFSNPTNTVAWSGTLEIGGNSGLGVFFDAHLAELLLYDHLLSTSERNALVSYFNARYALGMV